MKNESEMSPRDYFVALADYGRDLLDRLPLEREPQPLDYALRKLEPHLRNLKAREVSAIETLGKPSVERALVATGVGLNSIGMLMDRFTILLIKEWCLRNKGARDENKARALFEDQTRDIIEALCHARPGSSALNTKITAKKGEASATSWAEAFYGLLAINLVLWESQEILYIHDIESLPADELRAYVRWFSFGNLGRNEYIQKCEEFYWSPHFES